MDGTSELLQGNTIAEAFNKAGYGQGALRALDFYAEGNKTNEYIWLKFKKSWQNVIDMIQLSIVTINHLTNMDFVDGIEQYNTQSFLLIDVSKRVEYDKMEVNKYYYIHSDGDSKYIVRKLLTGVVVDLSFNNFEIQKKERMFNDLIFEVIAIDNLIYYDAIKHILFFPDDRKTLEEYYSRFEITPNDIETVPMKIFIHKSQLEQKQIASYILL